MSADTQPAAHDTSQPDVRQYRGLKTAVIVMGVLLVVGFILVFSTIIYRTVNIGDGEGRAGAALPVFGYEYLVSLPAGARVQKVTPEGDRLLIEASEPGGARLIIVLDPRRGREIGRFRLQNQ